MLELLRSSELAVLAHLVKLRILRIYVLVVDFVGRSSVTICYERGILMTMILSKKSHLSHVFSCLARFGKQWFVLDILVL